MIKKIGSIFFLVTVSLMACWPCRKMESRVLEGCIYLTGSEPFTKLAIESTDGNIYLLDCSEELKNKLTKMQNQTVQLLCSKIIIRENYRLAVVTGMKIVE